MYEIDHIGLLVKGMNTMSCAINLLGVIWIVIVVLPSEGQKYKVHATKGSALHLDGKRRGRFEMLFFLAFLFILVLYVAETGAGYRLSGWVFWLGFGGSISVFLASTLLGSDQNSIHALPKMLILIFVYSFMFPMLSPFYCIGYDSNFSVGSASRILESGWPVHSGQASGTVILVSDWPGNSILAGVVHETIAADWGSILRYYPPTVFTLIGISLFLFTRKLMKSLQYSMALSVVGPLAYGFLILEGFLNGGLGVPLIFFALYIISGACRCHKDTLSYSLLGIIVVLSIVITHHLSAFYLLIIVSFYYAYGMVDRLVKYGKRGRSFRTLGWNELNIRGAYVFLLLSVIAFYWTGVGGDVLEILYQAFVGIATVQVSTEPSSFYSNWDIALSQTLDGFLALSMVIFVVVNHYRRSKSARDPAWPHFLLASFMAAGVIIGGRIKGIEPELSRSLGVAYVFMLVALLSSRNRRGIRLKVSSLALFLVVSTYSLNQVYRWDLATGIVEPWDEARLSNQNYTWGGFVTDADLGAVLWMPSGEVVVGDFIIYALGSWTNLSVAQEPEVFQGNLSAADGIEWLVLREADKTLVFLPYQSGSSSGVPTAFVSYLNDNRCKVYDNGGVEIYSIQGVP